MSSRALVMSEMLHSKAPIRFPSLSYMARSCPRDGRSESLVEDSSEPSGRVTVLLILIRLGLGDSFSDESDSDPSWSSITSSVESAATVSAIFENRLRIDRIEGSPIFCLPLSTSLFDIYYLLFQLCQRLRMFSLYHTYCY